MDNVGRLKDGYASFAQGNIDAVLAIWDPQIEWHECKGMPLVDAGGNGQFVGHKAVVEGVLGRIPQHFDGFRIEIDEIFGSGDRAVMVGRYVGTLKATGRRFSAVVAHIWTFRNGRATKFIQVADTAEILNPKV